MAKIRVSSRALNPLSKYDDPSKTFCCNTQAKATTATKLFRDDEMLNALKRIVIPQYFDTKIRRGLDVWSAGCSSGEEVYSLASIALYMFKRATESSKVTIFGTDISTDQLSKGKRGRYLQGSSEMTLSKYKNVLLPYAKISDGVIQMGAEIRSHVKFGKFDLRRRPRNHTFNYITCNHVFQYYDDSLQIEFVRNFLSVLKPSGILFIEGLTAEALKKSEIEQIRGYRNLFKPSGSE